MVLALDESFVFHVERLVLAAVRRYQVILPLYQNGK